MSAPHERHLPRVMREIIDCDAKIAALAGPKTWEEHVLLRDLRQERARLTAGAHEVYGHTPARGDRGPSGAGAIAA